MPLSNINKAPLKEQRENSENTHHKKRRLSTESENRTPQNNKKIRHEESDPDMAETQKRANFSALSSPSNGFSRHASPLANKPGSAKKLVIKNFKGKILALLFKVFLK